MVDLHVAAKVMGSILDVGGARPNFEDTSLSSSKSLRPHLVSILNTSWLHHSFKVEGGGVGAHRT